MTMDAGEHQRQAQAAVRAQLLATGAFDVDQLCALRNDSSVRATENMTREAGNQVLAITVDGALVYPAFQFNDRGVPRDEISTLIEVLQVAVWGLGRHGLGWSSPPPCCPAGCQSR
jgi:hypothetical protein